jgi:PadR family transcriptional regulator PadR
MASSAAPMRQPTYFVLACLLEGPLHGYAIIRRAEELSGGGSGSPPERSTRRWTG